MEFKVAQIREMSQKGQRINRNIMEFKVEGWQ